MKQINAETGVCFFKVPAAADLTTVLTAVDFSPLAVVATPALISEWLDFGCVYVNGLRTRDNVPLLPEQVIRVHTRRKSYWNKGGLRDFIVEDNADFLVLDKPSGLPTHPTLDNYRENAKFLLEGELHIPLYTTHRLDIPTQGLLIIAKTLEAQRQLNKSFSLGRVEKIYRSINQARVENGVYTHFMNPESRVPKALQNGEDAKWWRCQLEILNSGVCADGFWHEIKLMTGKTHQIRAQMSFMGAPIVGDAAYGARETTASERIALECFRLSFALRSRTFAISRPKSIVAPPTPTDLEVPSKI